jgi:hypothetical protein
MKVKFITCIYSFLNGTEFGGRTGRNGHYMYSLLSLLRMTNADFLCYTNQEEIERLSDFFYNENQIDRDRFKLVVFDLKSTKYNSLINEYKQIESIKKGDRCFEIQYNKFFWFLDEDWSYDYYFWVDAGLSHCGIIPDKYLDYKDYGYQGYFNSHFFNNEFLLKLTEKTKDSVLIIAKDNTGSNYWMGTLPEKYYDVYNATKHVIGGLFGGNKESMKNFVSTFEEKFLMITEKEKNIFSEEQIMTLIYFNNPNIFNTYFFDVWWHENNVTKDCPDDYLVRNKSFYKVLEDIIS